MTSNLKFSRIAYNVKPINYNVTLVPNMKSFTFDGEQTVDVEVVDRTDTITFNARELKVTSVNFGDTTGEVVYDQENELVRFVFANALQVGAGKLHMKFQGILNDDMAGFYRSFWVDPNGTKRCILATQFESTSARRAFPCIDEPDRKATFDVSLVVPSNLTALSNMPEVSRTSVTSPSGLPELSSPDHYVKVQFSKSPIMSTYLLAMVVGDFEYVEDRDANGVLVRVYTPLGKRHAADFALNVTKKALPFYAKCFGVEYPLPKSDQIAIPDFAAGAMENWGLVTYRETALLVDPKLASMATKSRVATTVAHELAHMWFGNLVTMEWWTHLWLNEGFATWMQYLCTDHVHPEYDIWSEFMDSEQSTALDLDGMLSSHPIEVKVNSPAEVDEIFDSISYAKGASVIKMLYHYLGDKDFFNGLRHYINKFKYGNAQTEDLWDSFAEHSGKPVPDVMSSWTQQMGYPVVSVSKTPTGLSLRQSRFLSTGPCSPEHQQTWSIPVSVQPLGTDGDQVSVLMPAGQSADGPVEVTIGGGALVNPDRVGFFRVQYDEASLASVKQALREKKLSHKNRGAVLDDLASLAFAGYQPIVDLLDFLKHYAGEPHNVVWMKMNGILSHVRILLQEMATLEAFSASAADSTAGLDELCRELAVPVFEKIGWDVQPGEAYNESVLRPIILGTLGKAGYKPVVEEALRRFEEHHKCVMEQGGGASTTLHPDIRSTVYAMVLRNGTEREYKMVKELLGKAVMHDEVERILSALGAAQSDDLIKASIDFNLGDQVRKQDRFIVMRSLASNGAAGRRAVWAYVKANVDKLADSFGSQYLVAVVLKSACRYNITNEMHDEVAQFFQEHTVPTQRAVSQALEEIKINAAQVGRDGQGVVRYLCSMKPAA